MTNREAFERWAKEYGFFMPMVKVDGIVTYYFGNTESAWQAWQACAEHYEAVMRRAVDSALDMSTLIGDTTDRREAIIAWAKAAD